jgi:DNA-binding transcriptional regulator LsrR (DeoR family)
VKAEQDAREGRSGSEELLLRVAWFYYKDELTQEEIAKRLSVSRASSAGCWTALARSGWSRST